MQAPLAVAGFLLGPLACWQTGVWLYLLGALVLVSNWPYTLLGIMPTNTKLMSADPAIAGLDIRKLTEKWRHCMLFVPRSALVQHCCFCGRRCASSKLCLERVLRLKGRPAKASPKVGFKPMHFRPTPLQRLRKASSADWEEGVAIRLTSISPMMIESSQLSPPQRLPFARLEGSLAYAFLLPRS
jgi:hypothetical protein